MYYLESLLLASLRSSFCISCTFLWIKPDQVCVTSPSLRRFVLLCTPGGFVHSPAWVTWGTRIHKSQLGPVSIQGSTWNEPSHKQPSAILLRFSNFTVNIIESPMTMKVIVLWCRCMSLTVGLEVECCAVVLALSYLYYFDTQWPWSEISCTINLSLKSLGDVVVDASLYGKRQFRVLKPVRHRKLF